MPLVKRFILICLITVLTFGTVLGYALTRFLEESHLNRSVELSAEHMTSDITSISTIREFKAAATGEELQAFRARAEKMNFGPGEQLVKIWNEAGIIIWSSDLSLIGSNEAGDELLELALLGKKSGRYIEDPENGQELLEMYLPIRFEGSTRVDGVLEIYSDASLILGDLRSINRLVWLANFAGVAFLFFALAGLINTAANEIQKQNKEIARTEKSYRNLLRFAHDGIVVVNSQREIILFNEMAEKLFGWHESHSIGGRFDELLAGPSRKDTAIVIEALINEQTNEKGLLMSAKGIREDGTPFPIVISLSASGHGEERLVTAIIEDVTERQQL